MRKQVWIPSQSLRLAYGLYSYSYGLEVSESWSSPASPSKPIAVWRPSTPSAFTGGALENRYISSPCDRASPTSIPTSSVTYRPVRYTDFIEALTLRDLFLYLYFEGFSNPLKLEFLLESYTPDLEGNSLLQLVLRRDEVARAEWRGISSFIQSSHREYNYRHFCFPSRDWLWPLLLIPTCFFCLRVWVLSSRGRIRDFPTGKLDFLPGKAPTLLLCGWVMSCIWSSRWEVYFI